MRVLVLAGGFPKPCEKTDGNYVFAQIKELSKIADVKVISPAMFLPYPFCSLRNMKRFSAPHEYQYDSIDVISPKTLTYYNTSQHWWRFPNFFSKLYMMTVKRCVLKELKSKDYDAFYCMGSVLELGMVDAVKSEFSDLKIVYTEHSSAVASNSAKFKQYRKFYESRLRSVDRVIFVSQRQKKLIGQTILLMDKSVVLHNGFYAENVDSTGADNERIKLISVGFLEERKGYRITLSALAKLKNKGIDFEYAVIGDGRQRHEFEQLSSQLGLGDNVKFLGRLPHKSVLEQINGSDIFVLPSWDESFGIVYLEAMSCGVPVIGTKNEGIADIVTDGDNGFLVEKKNSAELEAVLHKLMTDDVLRKSAGENGRKTAEKYTWEANAKRLVEIIGDC